MVSYDGNGNVVALHNAADGSESAAYECSPFSEPIRVTGPVASLMPLRFSTMYEDNVTGDRKYLFRDYTPTTGRWKSRDPEEKKRDNLRRRHLTGSPIRCVDNNPLNSIDRLGLSTLKLTISYDDSVTDRNSLNRELTWMVLRLTGYLQMCSCDGNGPDVRTALSAATYSKPEDGYYEYNFPFKDPVADSVPVMFTMPPLGPIPALGYAQENKGVIIIAMNEPKIFPDVLAHELGHVAGYVGDLDRYHAKDLNNLMHIPELGQLKLPDKQWCDKVKALAK